MANDQLKIYKNQLTSALESAATAQGNIDKERLRLGKSLARKTFFTASEHRAELQAAEAREVQHALVIIRAMKATYSTDPADHKYPVWDAKFFADRDSPRGRVEIAMMQTAIERWRLDHDHAEEADPVDPGGGDNIVELATRRIDRPRGSADNTATTAAAVVDDAAPEAASLTTAAEATPAIIPPQSKRKL
jgi:hypothetical protein